MLELLRKGGNCLQIAADKIETIGEVYTLEKNILPALLLRNVRKAFCIIFISEFLEFIYHY